MTTEEFKDPLSDFRVFLYLVWKFLGLPDPTPVQYDIAQYLQRIYHRKGPRRAIIQAFRGVGKTWITVAFVCWALYCNPQLKPFLTRIYPVTTEEVKHSIQKEKRIIDTLEPVMNQHRLIVDRSLIEQDYKSTQHLPSEQALKYQLFYQMSRITRERGALAQDDRLDALAIAVGYWVEAMACDVDKAMSDAKEQKLKDALHQFMAHVLGETPKEQRWMDV